MTDAVKVGMSIAFRGGISAEITRARREIAQFEAALAAAGMSVRQLCEVAARGGALSKAAPQRNALFDESEELACDEPPTCEEVSAAQTGAATTGTNLHGPAMVTRSKNIRLNDSVPRTDDSDVAPSPVAKIQYASSISGQANSASVLTKGEPNAWPASPILMQKRHLNAAAELASSLEAASERAPASVVSVAPTAAMQTASVSNGSISTYGSVQSPASKAMFSGLRNTKPPSPPAPLLVDIVDNGRLSDVPSAPRLFSSEKTRMRDPLRRNLAQSTSMNEVSASKQNAATLVRQSPEGSRHGQVNDERTQGDIFLDGVLVGRWISRLLNREAERASVGPTGFDMRRGRLMPGATVGQ